MPPVADTTTQTLPDGTVITKWLAFGTVIEIRTKGDLITVNEVPVQALTQKELAL